MSSFSDTELAYLTGDRRLGRVATVGKDGTPHVAPVGWEQWLRVTERLIWRGGPFSCSQPDPSVRRGPRS
jgi:Pyridoxamine 5'-phosphate oxidase